MFNMTDVYAGTVPLWAAGGDRLWSSPVAPASAALLACCTRVGPAMAEGSTSCLPSWLATIGGLERGCAHEADIVMGM
eukprot:4686864-Alexandrium_andersonii.AAC.1